MSEEATREQAAAEFEAVQSRLRQVDAELAQLEQDAAEIRRVLRTLEGLGAHDALVPIGAGVHVRARLQEGPVVVALGAGYAADQDIDTARQTLEGRAAQVAELVQRAQQEAQALADAANDLVRSLNG